MYYDVKIFIITVLQGCGKEVTLLKIKTWSFENFQEKKENGTFPVSWDFVDEYFY